MVEKVGYECPVCGKVLSTKSGLVGHRMFSHPEPVEQPSGSPEEVLLEVLGGVKEALDRMDGRVKDWGSQLVGLEAKIVDASGRLDGFQGSFIERLTAAQAAHQAAEHRADAAAARHSIPTVAEAALMAASCAECAERLGLIVDDGAAARGWSNPGPEAAAEAAAELAAELPSRRWLIVRPGPAGGFKWRNRGDNCPGLPADRSKVEGYCKVTSDAAEVEKFRVKSGIEVIELEAVEESVS